MALGETVIDAIRSKLTDANAKIRYAGEDSTLDGEITAAICTGVEREPRDTEQGQYRSAVGAVRYKKSLEPAAWSVISQEGDEGVHVEIPIIGQPVEVLLSPDTDWDAGTPIRLRVRNRLVQGGAVRLDVVGEFEES